MRQTRIQSLETLDHLGLFTPFTLSAQGKKRRTCPLIFEPIFLNPLSFNVDRGWYHHRCCTVPAIQVPEMVKNHPPSCLGSWSPLETHRAGGISPSPSGAPSGWRPIPAVPQADRGPVRGPVISGQCQDLPRGHQLQALHVSCGTPVHLYKVSCGVVQHRVPTHSYNKLFLHCCFEQP